VSAMGSKGTGAGADLGGMSSPLLKAILQQMAAGILVVDAGTGRLLLSNRQMEEILGRPPASGDMSEWEGFHPDGHPYAAEEWPLTRALHHGEIVEGEEVEIVRADGSHGFVRIGAVPIRGPDGDIVAAVATCFDVTEQRRRHSSRKFLADAGALLASSGDFVTILRNLARLAVPTLADWCTIDLLREDGLLERVAVEHIDRRMASFAAELARKYPPDPDARAGVGHVVRTGKPVLVREVTADLVNAVARTPHHHKLLSELGIRSAMFVPLIASGKTLGAIGLVSAESGRRYSNDDLEVAQELATRAALAIENARLSMESRAATDAKSDFLAVMSHELRTPLTAIIGYAELLQLGVPEPVSETQREQAERIEVSARHLLQLIEEILTLVTLESGETRVRVEEVRIADLLERAVKIIEPMARAKGLTLRDTTSGEDEVLQSDADKILQILLNLLSNAVKFTERGEITISARRNEAWFDFEVSDTGIGVSEEQLRQIFEPFWQAEPPITRRAGGTGLGLTIGRRLADMLGGEIRVRSEKGKGSTFSLRIPYRAGGGE
jgi:PAS domain S-box-containing protein